MSTEPSPSLSATPQRREEVRLHEVPSDLEGTRFVLEDPSGRTFELPGGEADAFVWARLDGRTSLAELGRDYFEAFGALPPDLPGLVERLRAGGMLSEAPPERADTGSRLARLAAALAVIRLPVPGSGPLWRAIGRLAAPACGRLAAAAAIVLTFLGLLAALGPASALTVRPDGAPLLLWPAGDGPASLLLGLLALLALNLAVDLLEATAQVAVLARGGHRPGRIGVSFDLLVPGIFVETPDALLLPLERRVGLALAPLLTAVGVAGAATVALAWGAPAAWGLVLHKLAWVAWLRTVAHLSPLTPSPLHDALCARWQLPRLRTHALRFLRRPSWGEDGPSPRELRLLLYLGLSLVHLVAVARLGLFLARAELLPAWNAAPATDPARPLLLLLAAAGIGLPTLVALVAGAALAVQAGLRAVTGDAPRPGRAAAALGGGAVSLAALPWGLGELPAEHPALAVGLGLALLLAAAGAGLGARRAATTGHGWGALDGAALATASGALALLVALMSVDAASASGLLHGVAADAGVTLLGLVLGLAVASWGALEVGRSARRGVAPLALAPVALAVLVGFAPGAAAPGQTLFGATGPAVAALLAAGAALGSAAALRGRGGGRAGGLLLGALAAAALAACWVAWVRAGAPHPTLTGVTPRGLHLPLLAASLLAAIPAVLARADRVAPTLPPFTRALDEGPAGAAPAAFAAEALLAAAEATLGAGPAGAVAAPLRAAGLEVTRARGRWPGGRWSVASGAASPVAARLALAAAARALADRGGSAFARRALDALAARLPACAHELLVGASAALLPPVREAPAARRRELLQGAVQLADLDAPALERLAAWVGLLEVPAGATVVRQGDEGDRFYVIARGAARVLVEDVRGERVAVARLAAGDGFGEAALLRHEPRSATVVAEAPTLLLVLERDTFAAVLQERPELIAAVIARQEDLRLVREVPLFAHLTAPQVAALCRRLRPVRVAAGEAVLRQGEAGDRFYLVRDGELEVRREQGAGGEDEVVARLSRGDTFGEVALLLDVPRTATVRATRDSDLLGLERADFHALLAGVQALAERSRRWLSELGSPEPERAP